MPKTFKVIAILRLRVFIPIREHEDNLLIPVASNLLQVCTVAKYGTKTVVFQAPEVDFSLYTSCSLVGARKLLFTALKKDDFF